MITIANTEYTKDETYIRNWDRLTEIPKDIPENVKYVEIQLNDIRNLKAGDFSRLSQCEVMNLDDNSIRNIESGSFSGLDSLKNLSICTNWILEMEEEMWQGMQNLHEITLCTSLFGKETQIHNGTFSSLPTLEILHLGHHGLRSLKAEMWNGLNSLTTLDIHGNRIAIIGTGSFGHLTSLKKLFLVNNRLEEIEDGAFAGLSNLVELDLSENSCGVLGSHYRCVKLASVSVSVSV